MVINILIIITVQSSIGDISQCLVYTKDSKMVLDASLLNTQHYKVWIKGKVEQSRERSHAFPYTLV